MTMEGKTLEKGERVGKRWDSYSSAELKTDAVFASERRHLSKLRISAVVNIFFNILIIYYGAPIHLVLLHPRIGSQYQLSVVIKQAVL